MDRWVPEAIANPIESQIALTAFDCGLATANFEYAINNHGNGRSYPWANALQTMQYEISVIGEDLDPRAPAASSWTLVQKPIETESVLEYLLDPSELKLMVMESGQEQWRLANFKETNDFITASIDLAWKMKELEQHLKVHTVAGIPQMVVPHD